MRVIRIVTSSLVAITLLAAASSDSSAKKSVSKEGPNCYETFKGKIILDKRPFPKKFKTGKACVRYMKPRSAKSSFHRSPSLDWNLYMFIFFNEPIGGDEFSLQVYKVSGEDEAFVTEETYPISPKLTTFFGEITLSEDEFEVGPQYEMRAIREINGEEKIYATKRFTLLELQKKPKKKIRKRR